MKRIYYAISLLSYLVAVPATAQTTRVDGKIPGLKITEITNDQKVKAERRQISFSYPTNPNWSYDCGYYVVPLLTQKLKTGGYNKVQVVKILDHIQSIEVRRAPVPFKASTIYHEVGDKLIVEFTRKTHKAASFNEYCKMDDSIEQAHALFDRWAHEGEVIEIDVNGTIEDTYTQLMLEIIGETEPVEPKAADSLVTQEKPLVEKDAVPEEESRAVIIGR